MMIHCPSGSCWVYLNIEHLPLGVLIAKRHPLRRKSDAAIYNQNCAALPPYPAQASFVPASLSPQSRHAEAETNMTAIMEFHVFVGAGGNALQQNSRPRPLSILQILSPVVTDKGACCPERELPSLPKCTEQLGKRLVLINPFY